ncbi:GDSL esterase/lipase 2-like [Mercurialis annua]|uniref:GDSL esterase/lipase 2-like n=1 Tax=Mercurialis annua TaxID=3986 RepID=UPI00215FB2C8|nr:GDSL esterase/lipase 2-like [Mercurialis annua]
MANVMSEFLFLILFSSLVIQGTRSQKNDAALFIFGDSLLDAGNNNYIKNPIGRVNFWPYGKTFFNYPTGRFSDGRIIPDFIAEYLKLPFISPYLEPGNDHYTNGVNFASGGAGALVGTYPGRVINLETQVVNFKKVKKQLRQELGDEETKALLSRAIFLISIGSNDYVSPFSTNSTVLHQYTRQDYVGMVIGNLTVVLKEMYKHGGRKFAIIGLTELGRVPLMKALSERINDSGGSLKEVTALAKLHNRELAKALEELETEQEGFKYSNFDIYTSANDRIDNPSKFGFKEGKEACCGSGPFRGFTSCGGKGAIKEYELCENPSDYLFFDGVHPTEKFNNQLANLMCTGNHKVTNPYNLQRLVAA